MKELGERYERLKQNRTRPRPSFQWRGAKGEATTHGLDHAHRMQNIASPVLIARVPSLPLKSRSSMAAFFPPWSMESVAARPRSRTRLTRGNLYVYNGELAFPLCSSSRVEKHCERESFDPGGPYIKSGTKKGLFLQCEKMYSGSVLYCQQVSKLYEFYIGFLLARQSIKLGSFVSA